MNCLLIYIDYSNSGYQQNMAYGTYPQATQQATMGTSYPNYSIPASVSSGVVYTNPSQVTVPSAASYNYATGQAATQYPAPPSVPSYTAYQVPAAPASSAAAPVPPPPVVGADAAQYGVRPPPPPPPPNQQNVSLGPCCCYIRGDGVLK